MMSFGQASKHYWAFASISSIHCLYPYAHGPPVRVETLYRSQLHNCPRNIPQAFSCEIRACDMLCKGAKIDTGVLAGVAVGCW
jgi:hypothetical protein